MPKIEVKEDLFYELYGKRVSDERLLEIFPAAKAELDGHEDGTIKIELNDTNRPDLWSAAGVARALRTYESGEIKEYPFFSKKGDFKDYGERRIINDPSVIGIRDFSIGFAARGKRVDDALLRALIQEQEKLCWNFGRKRKTIAMGIYRSELIKYPVHYSAVDPDKTKFVPLGMTEELSLREILEVHPKGKEYGYIVKDYPRHPYLTDDNGDTLSNPPIINSARIGAIEVGDSDFFIEVSGPILDDLLLAVAILSCDMYDMGWEILPVKAELAKDTAYGREIVLPYYFQRPQKTRLSDVRKTLGEELSMEECLSSLRRMGVKGEAISPNEIEIAVPEYRNDFLHSVDIIEDIMIGHGLKNFAPEMPTDFTVGRLSREEENARKVKDLMVGLGFQEMMYNYLGSKREYIDNMHISGDDVVFISNPMSENYEVIRPSILPSLLESESVSSGASYPHNIYEIGKVTFKDPSDNSGTRTINSLGFLSSDATKTYNDAASIVQTLMYFLRKDFALEEVKDDPRFIPGRAAHIVVSGRRVGIFGETHPEVLTSWDSTMPTVMGEINLDELFKREEPSKEEESEDKDADLRSWCERVTLRVSRIVGIKRHPGGDRLYILSLDTGEDEERTIVSSIVPFYREEELLGRSIVLVSNLRPASFRGVKSYGMLLAAQEEGDESHSTCEVIFADGIPVGTVLEAEGIGEVEKADGYVKPEGLFSVPMRTEGGYVTVGGRRIGKGGVFLTVQKYRDGIVG